ncbi:hypothetical protein [Bacillus sp. FJAT-27245]|uniref:hypothetical protein n=1 Tax=Bacillus sp. FJAT-27245 TaxID=1684144 RepID=UPI0006A774FB|nr:hypothetical protein [Bacillus sp. FJAT-27245]
MKKHLFLLSLTVLILTLLASCSGIKIVVHDFDQVTFYKINDANEYEKIAMLKDKKKIEVLIEQINEAKRKNAHELEFEKGPAGMLLFEKEGQKLEVPIFTDTGNVLTKEYYISSSIDIEMFFGTRK